MKIEIKKKTTYYCEYTITRSDKSVELIALETKTYFLHDICHYVVEKNLNYSKGFWGMLSDGYSLNELSGKENVHTESLRFIEQVVGPVQSTYLGQIPKQKFDQFVSYFDFKMPEGVLEKCLAEIDEIMKMWERLSMGEQLTLEWMI